MYSRHRATRTNAASCWRPHRRVIEDEDDVEVMKPHLKPKTTIHGRQETLSLTKPATRQVIDITTVVARTPSPTAISFNSNLVEQRPVDIVAQSARTGLQAAQQFFAGRDASMPGRKSVESSNKQETLSRSRKAGLNTSASGELITSPTTTTTSTRVPGQLTTHQGQRGRWLCTSGPSYRFDSLWLFVSEQTPSKQPRGRKKSTSKPKSTFLSLPGELRNQIYKYVIPKCRILIITNKPNKDLDKRKRMRSEQEMKHKKTRTQLGHLLDSDQISQGLSVTRSLLLASKDVRDDVEGFLYSRMTFCFSSTKVLSRFLNTASEAGLKAIKNIEISHTGYGNPEKTQDQIYRTKYYDLWKRTCIQVGQNMTGLQYLKLTARLTDWPCDFTAHPPAKSTWREACLHMAPRRLAKVEVKLRHDMIDRNISVLKDLAQDLENDLTTLDGQNERDRLVHLQVMKEVKAKQAEEAAQAAAVEAAENAQIFGPPQLKELVISAEDVKVHEKGKTSLVKVCGTGLENYFQLNVAEMSPGELRQFNDKFCRRSPLQHDSGVFA